MWSKIEEAISEIKNGRMVIVVDDEDRENEGDLIMAAEKVSNESVNFMMREGRGLICVPLDESIADKLSLEPMTNKNTEFTKCNFTVSVDYKFGTSTGISASDRAKTIKALSFKNSKPDDFAKPGHIFPIRAKKGGVLVRAGHTEAATDLARLAGLRPVGALCEIINEDGEMARTKDLIKFAKKHNLKIINIKELISYRRKREKQISREVESKLPTEWGDFKIIAYKSLMDDKEYIVMQMGDVKNKKDVLVRVHSECITGDLFKSLRCDCGKQLVLAMQKIAKEKEGVILYMRQEGRGIGLFNKLKAYNLQDEGHDTVEANKILGFKDDLREYGIGAQILKDLGISSMKLMTNNPKKIVGIEGYDLKVTEVIAIESEPHKLTKSYLKTKKEKMGHNLKRV